MGVLVNSYVLGLLEYQLGIVSLYGEDFTVALGHFLDRQLEVDFQEVGSLVADYREVGCLGVGFLDPDFLEANLREADFLVDFLEADFSGSLLEPFLEGHGGLHSVLRSLESQL